MVQLEPYNREEIDVLLEDKLNISDQIDAYTKQEVDELLSLKLNISDEIDAYSMTEDDALLLLNADKTELDNYVDLTSTQMINNQKQFGIISVSSISKQNKSDVSILLTIGGGMFVSSLVSQSQLQEVRDMVSRKSKRYVFATTYKMNTWMDVYNCLWQPNNKQRQLLGIQYLLILLQKYQKDKMEKQTYITEAIKLKYSKEIMNITQLLKECI
ncbi:MAG: hypothetical protein EZS28_030667 [Streblomastix strix]|uniref:Uncharacterized protein n=1 Tax=Streblomastix strix TaxID=222440 RepID=A0A5J4UTV5_9EUKA|nr:MAG: hypothetical protein EZS28_030667 [Streblomastix strix]